ncbi:MAG: hypothetical protein ACOC8P_00460 [Dichotomicrobium sp.]
MTLEEMLNDMARFGHPRLGRYGDDRRWICKIELSISAPGVESFVRSDWVDDPVTEVSQCYERLHVMVDQIRNSLGTARGKALEVNE